MTMKAKDIADQISGIISQWMGVETVVLGEAIDTEVHDPYFHVDLDVYHRGDILPSNDRREQFCELISQPSVFETSPSYAVDSFLLEGLPISVTYNQITRIEMILERVKSHSWVLRDSGTNMFYRIDEGKILYSKSDWICGLREKLGHVFEGFWDVILDSSRHAMEGYVRDISASAFRSDKFMLLVASAGFVKSLCTFVYALNKRFEPSDRLIIDKMRNLKRLPDELIGRLETFLRQDDEITPEKKMELAELLTKSLISMS